MFKFRSLLQKSPLGRNTNDEMTNDESSTNPQSFKSPSICLSPFELRYSEFIRHSSFVIRHLRLDPLLQQPLPLPLPHYGGEEELFVAGSTIRTRLLFAKRGE